MDVHILRNLVMRYGIKLGLSSSQKDCIWQLLDHDWNGKNFVWPGQKRVGERLGIKTRQGIYKIIKILEEKGLIEVIDIPGKNHRYEWVGLIKALLPFYQEEIRLAKEKIDRLTIVNEGGKLELTGEVNSSLQGGKLELTRSTINNTANKHEKEIQQPGIFSNINPQEASIPQASTNIQEDPKTAENILDLQKAEEIVKNHFNTNGKYDKEIHKKLKPMVVKDSITENELIQQLEAAGTIWKWFGKNEPRPQPVQSYQKEYPKNGRAKVESNVETGLERWTRDFMIGKLIPLDTELNDDQQRLFYNRKSHPKIFQPAYDGSWPQEEILRRYEIYMNRGGYYAKAGHPLALFVSQFDQFAKRKKRQRVDKSKLLFGGRTETDGSGDFVYEMPPEQRAKMHAEDKALAEKYRKERIERNGGEDYEDDFGLKLSKLDE